MLTFQSSKSIISFAGSVMISAIEYQRKGNGEPPKVSLREIGAMLSITVELAAAECHQRVNCL